MARKKKSSAKCKLVTVCGKRRKICRDAKGRIKSNRPASGSASKSTKRRSSSASKGKWVKTSRANAVRKSGKNKGRLKAGCKFTKTGAACRKK